MERIDAVWTADRKTGMTGSGVRWSGILRDTECGVETNKSHVKYEANVSELACDELN